MLFLFANTRARETSSLWVYQNVAAVLTAWLTVVQVAILGFVSLLQATWER